MLINENSYKAVKFYAGELFVSERTIHSDLKAITDYLSLKGFSIEKRRGVGIRLIKSLYEHNETKIWGGMVGTEAGSRRRDIIQRLLFDNEIVTFDKLSEDYMVSKTSISQDFRFIENVITQGNNLQLVSDTKGTRFVGDEEAFQKGHFEFNNMIFEEDIFLESSDNSELLDKLKVYYGEDVVNVCSIVLYKHMKVGNKDIAEHYIFNVLNMLIIIVYRITKGHHIDDTKKENIQNHFLDVANDLLNKITTELGVIYTKNDATYLHQYLLSNKFYKLDEEQYLDILKQIVEQVRQSVQIKNWDEKKLIDLLKNHFSPMIYRLRNGIKIRNPFINQIKKEFGVLFNITWIVMSEYEESLEITFNEDEIGFLVIYFQSAIEQAHITKSILVVCPTGIATSGLLVNRIRKVVPESSTIKVSSTNNIQKKNLAESDLVISTVNINLPGKKVLTVSPLLNSIDMKKISEAYNEKFVFHYKNNIEPLDLQYLPKFIEKEYVLLNENFDNKEDLITSITERLIKSRRVQKEALENILKREKLGGTDLPSGAAIPHVTPNYVNETTIVIVRNKQAFKWDEYPVKLIILLYISESDISYIKDVFADIYQIVESKERVNEFNNLVSKNEFLKIIGGDEKI